MRSCGKLKKAKLLVLWLTFGSSFRMDQRPVLLWDCGNTARAVERIRSNSMRQVRGRCCARRHSMLVAGVSRLAAPEIADSRRE